jgi:hypothetical protein
MNDYPLTPDMQEGLRRLSALFGSGQNTKLLYCTFRLVSTTSMINLYPVQKQKKRRKQNECTVPSGRGVITTESVGRIADQALPVDGRKG